MSKKKNEAAPSIEANAGSAEVDTVELVITDPTEEPAPDTTEIEASAGSSEPTEEPVPDTERRPQDAHPAFRHLHTFSEDRLAKLRTAGVIK